MPRKPFDALSVLSSMNDAQAKQFQAATLLAIGIAMNKMGLQKLTIEEADLRKFNPTSKLRVDRTPNGGITYTLVNDIPAEPGTMEG